MRHIILWCIVGALLSLTACSSLGMERKVTISDLISDLQKINAKIGDQVEVKPGFIVVAFLRRESHKIYPELGCVIYERAIPPDGGGSTSRMTTYALDATEKLANQPLLVLEDQFDDYQVTCLFIRADLIDRQPAIFLTMMDGSEKEIANPNPNGVVIVNKNSSSNKIYRQYSLVDRQEQLIYRTDTPDKGFP